MKKTYFRQYVVELLKEDNEEIPESAINYYVEKIIENLKFYHITQKSVDEISLHEFWQKKGYVLLVRVIYNGDFEVNFEIFRKR